MPRFSTFALLALISQAPAQEVTTYDGRTAAEWRGILAEQQEAVEILAAGGALALPILRELLVDEDETVAQRAVRACGVMGPPAATATTDLLGVFRTARRWWTRSYCAQALGLIGNTDPDVMDALVGGLQDPAAAHLRQVCSKALWQLDDDAGRRILTELNEGAIRDRDHAIDALVWGGEPAIPVLVEALDANAVRAGAARDALARIGWRAVPALERAGHRDLVPLVLQRGPLEHVRLADRYELVWGPPTAEALGLAGLAWERGSGHGGGLTLSWAAEDRKGFRVEQIVLVGPKIGDPRPHAVTVRYCTLPRARAMALTRQLVALARSRVIDKDPGNLGVSGSTADFHARLRVDLREETVLDEHWAGYPSTANAPERFRVEAAMAILYQAVQDAVWQTRPPTPEDVARVTARRAHPVEDQVGWVSRCLDRMAELLTKDGRK